MALKRIKDFPDGSGSLTNDDIFIFMDDPSGTSVTKKISLSQISASIGGGGGGTSNVTISNSGLNRVLVSDGSTSGIVGQANLSFNGSLLNVTGSGNFNTALTVNNTGVSLVGHTHTSSNITDFNSSVSGLLPTIENSGDNRLLTSTGTTTGVNAESNATFNGTTLSVSGVFVATSGSFTQRLDFPLSYFTVSPAVSGTVNDWNPGGVSDVIRASGHFTARINGLVDTYGVDALLLYNVGTSGSITLTHASGTANNQFLVPWLGDYVLDPNGGAALIVRDKVVNKWRIT